MAPNCQVLTPHIKRQASDYSGCNVGVLDYRREFGCWSQVCIALLRENAGERKFVLYDYLNTIVNRTKDHTKPMEDRFTTQQQAFHVAFVQFVCKNQLNRLVLRVTDCRSHVNDLFLYFTKLAFQHKMRDSNSVQAE